MGELLDRRKSELEFQLESLPLELARWEDLTRKRDFEKHHSQVIVLGRQMRALNQVVRDTWNGAGDFGAVQKAQRDCASVQRMWDYYREKLMMRFDPTLGPYLRAADAYVWHCYEPVLKDRRAANPGQPFREPPLTAFDAEVSPWAQSRRTSGEAAVHAANNLPAPDEAPMPVAVLGIPWSTLQHLPNLAALAHETGHVVEADFALRQTISDALLAATRDSALSEGWSDFWLSEVFADLFGCYAAGPSFVWTLTESIPDTPAQVETRRRPSEIPGDKRWGKYPPATLRLLMNVCALRHLGYSNDADKIERYWMGDYPRHAMGDYVQDVKTVVPTVYAAAKLPEELNWKKLEAEFFTVRENALRQRDELCPAHLYNPRTLVAIAGDVYRAPPAGADVKAVWARLQKHIVESRPPGVLDGQKERVADGVPVLLRTEQIANVLFAHDVVDE